MSGKIIVIVVGILLVAVLSFWMFAERWRLLRPSAWHVLREGGLRRLLNLSIIHAYIYGRWNHQYLKILFKHINPYLGSRGKKWLSDHYHSKVLTQEQAKTIITINQEIPLQDLEQIIPYPVARDFVLKESPDVAVFECACRHARKNPCKPTQVCMVVGQPFVDFMLEHHPKSTRRLTQAEALELLQAEHERGHLHSAWFKDACIDRFFAICNCCKCCCGGIEAMMKYGIPIMASSGYVAQIDKDLCTACGTCVDACPFDAISIKDTNIVINWEKCMGCGVCVGQCPNKAVSLALAKRTGMPLDVRLLTQEQVGQ